MCGIFAYIGNKKNGPKIVFEGIKELEYRGYDSWGIAVQGSNSWWVKKQVGKIGSYLGTDLPDGNTAFGHTRWATHGGITTENAHPHLDCTGELALIHNGIVENYEELKEELLQQGHVFTSETDSEVIVHLIEKYAANDGFEQGVIKAYKRLRGQSAIIVSQLKKSICVAVKNGSPLVIGYGEKSKYIASDSSALVAHTQKAYFLEDDQIAVVSGEQVLISNVRSGQQITPNIVLLKKELRVASKGNFNHYMLKEIHEQSTVIEQIAQSAQLLGSLVSDIHAASKTIFMGCGSAYHAGIAAQELMRSVAGREVFAEVASDFSEKVFLWGEKDLLIALSQSGETMDVLEAVKTAQKQGLHIDALVNVYGSTLYRLAKTKVLLQAGTEKAVASTKAFTAKLATILMASYALSKRDSDGKKRLMLTAKAIKKLLMTKRMQKLKRHAKNLKKEEHLFIVGRGLSYVAALETALKIKEITYIHAEAFRGSEIKHGPIALISKNTKCLLFIPNDQHFEENISTAQELKARGGYIIAISPKENDVFDEHIAIEDMKVETIFSEIVIGQLLAYFIAVVNGLDPDMPRNLAKSVTVK